MYKSVSNIFKSILLASLAAMSSNISAETPQPMPTNLQAPPANHEPLVTPAPPAINAKAYILIDANSGRILAEKNSNERLPPASLTKMMTLYVVFNALSHQQIKLSDMVRISELAWKTGGSRMFVKEGQEVPVEDLLKGIIVDSGNDACVALSEHVGGSEASFTDIMNQQAKKLGMNNSHFTDSTGLPDPNHYTTAMDLAILGRALVNDFPNNYPWYSQKWFTFNGIRQPNRNRLLWRNSQVDGIKTGHTNEAGFCLVSSAKRDNMRLISVVLGAPSDASRADDSERLLNYGFRFFESHALYKAGKPITEVKLYKGKTDKLALALAADQYITIPSGQYSRLHVTTNLPKYVQAPIKKGDKVGELIIQFDNNTLAKQPLYAMADAESAGIFKRAKDSIVLSFKGWFGS